MSSAKKRKAPDAGSVDNEAAAAKRNKEAIDALTEEFACPITQELPVEPVTAADGRVYERAAIEAWIKKPRRGALKSPHTNMPMGRTLLPAMQVRNTIRRMVESGAIVGDRVAAWQAKIKEEVVVAAMRRKAESGDADAMNLMGCFYDRGEKGLPTDKAQAFAWFKRAADLDNPLALYNCGTSHFHGIGVASNTSAGLIMIGQAAALSVEAACHFLGRCDGFGVYGFPRDKAQARKWFHKMETCLVKFKSNELREEATKWLRTHPEGGDESEEELEAAGEIGEEVGWFDEIAHRWFDDEEDEVDEGGWDGL